MKNDTEAILEQYKIMVETTSEITRSRQAANNFYLALNTFLLGALSFIQNIPRLGNILVCIVGIVISIIWRINISSYRDLNSAKFKVIINMEKKLPVALFREEQNEYKKIGYKELTWVEKFVPAIFIIIYLAVLAAPYLIK